MSRNGRNTATTTTKRPASTRSVARARGASNAAGLKAQQAFLKRFVREKQAAWDALTPAERRAEQHKWRRFVKSINAGRRRKVIVE